MDIWQMKYFIQIYTDRSLSNAAKNLFISQQALSKTLKKLESELQVPLFDRMIKGLKPTKYGNILYEKAKKIIYEYDEMMNAFKNQEMFETSTLCVGTSNILNTDKIKELCLDYQKNHSKTTLEFYELGYYSCEEYLKEGRIDIGFSLKPNNKTQFDYTPVIKYNMMILMNKKNPLGKKLTLGIKDLKDEFFIMQPADSKIRKLIINYCLQAGYYPNILLASSQLDIIIELIDMNKGIAILPECSAEKALSLSNNITILSLRDCKFKIEAGFIINKNTKANYLAKEFIDYYIKNL